MRPSKFAATIAFVPLLALCGCSATALDLPYYLQSVQGHLAVMGRARPIDEVLADADTDPRVAARLRTVAEIREFASRELALPENGSFRRYADIGRQFVVWNVFAAPELSLKLKRWCFPVAGCVAYRGYFDPADAQRYGQSLSADGWDVRVAGVPAYSTLGWFDDPVLSTFIQYPEGELARLIFHELAHQVVYVKGDTTFNESFATAVEEAGVERWLARRGDPAAEAAYRQLAQRRSQFLELLRSHRAKLEAIYSSDADDAAKREGKAAVFASLRSDYRALKASWNGYRGYDRWFAQPLGNAHLGSVATYTALVPGFRRLLREQGDDMARFFDAVRRLARKDKAERERLLAEPAPGQAAGDAAPSAASARRPDSRGSPTLRQGVAGEQGVRVGRSARGAQGARSDEGLTLSSSN